jgi:hypothetical protein
MAILTFYTVGVVLLALFIFKQLVFRRKRNPLPPGPKPIPILGNIADLPAPNSQEWRHWLKYKERYGDIFSLTVMGQTLIVLHDKNAAFQLMEKRATNYSDRPWLEYGMGMYARFQYNCGPPLSNADCNRCGFDQALPAFPYGDKLRRHRKLFHSQMGTKPILRKYDSVMELWSSRFLLLLLKDPKNLEDHVRA